MKQRKSVAGWLESDDNPVKDVVRRVRDTIRHADERIKEAIKGDGRAENEPAAKKKATPRKRAARASAAKARPRKKAARAKKAARKKTSSRTRASKPGAKKARRR
jgi:hypothetical protein